MTVQGAPENLMRGRTSFVIAYGLSTITKADRIIVLDDGRLVEQGTYAGLLAMPSCLYRRLHAMQFRWDVADETVVS